MVVSDFRRFYGIRREEMKDLGYKEFHDYLWGMGQDSRFMSHMASLENGQPVGSNVRAAADQDELLQQYQNVGAKLMGMSG